MSSSCAISGFFFSFWPKGKRRGQSLCLAQMALSLVECLCELSCIFFGMFHQSVQRDCPRAGCGFSSRHPRVFMQLCWVLLVRVR